VIKKSLDVVKGSTLLLSWYTNLLSAIVLAPLVVLAGELPAVLSLFYGQTDSVGSEGMSTLQTFLWGSAITVSYACACIQNDLFTKIVGCSRVHDEPRKPPLHQSNLTHHAHGLLGRPGRRRLPPGEVALWRYYNLVCVLPGLA
jgi:hypothetical protein